MVSKASASLSGGPSQNERGVEGRRSKKAECIKKKLEKAAKIDKRGNKLLFVDFLSLIGLLVVDYLLFCLFMGKTALLR